MSVFSKNRVSISRKHFIPKAPLASIVPVPKGATQVHIYARNQTATACNVSAGNVASGAQFAAATAVPVGTVANPGVVNPLEIYTAAGRFYVYPTDGNIHITCTVANIVDVVVEFDELLNSLPLMTAGSYAGGQAGVAGVGQ